MPNFSYKNISEILTTQDPIRGVRILQSDLNGRIIVPRFSSLNQPDDPFAPYTNIEFHAFLPNGAYVDTLYNINYNVVLKENPNGETIKYVVLDIHNDLRDARLIPGPYKVVYNFFRNVIGSSERENRLFISDISSDRKEIKLSLTDPNDLVSRKELSDFVLEYMAGSKYMMPVVLNFGQNNIVHVINVTSDGDPNYFYVRLIDPLPSDLDNFFQCWLGSQIMKPYIDNVIVIRDDIDDMPSYISGPNFDVEYDYWTNSETSYKSWNELLQTNVQTSQEIVNRYLLNSGSYTKLNYDFTQFENFIFYSSAEERIENFYYKIQLIEHYNSELDTLNTYTGSLDLNKTKVKNLREKVVSGFDDFEKWMYYETTASGIYTYQASSSIIPYPKYEVTSSDYHIATKEGKYKLYAVTSSQVDDWYTNLLDIATDYDMLNENSLHKAIPEYLRDDTDNDQFTTFVNMIGQHFDILYFYTDHILKKNLREEHPKDGLSQDLIFEATKNMGWQLSHGTQTKDLWEYAFGLSGSGEPIWTGKTTISKYHTKTEEERTKEVWRRIFNNLSYIYKTKGTARGIKALLAAYGIPQTILSIREFGGPDNADLGVIPRYEWEKHTYYLNYSGSFSTPTPTQYVRVPWERVNNADGNWQYADTVTFRWKMEPNDYYTHAVDPIQTILQKNSGSKVDWFVDINKTGSNDEYGDLTFHMRGEAVTTTGDWSKISAGFNHTAAVKTDGTLWSWGLNTNGQLGQDDKVSRSSPVQVGSDNNWSHVAAGDYYTIAIKTNGTLWAWGQNTSFGELGQGDKVSRSSPVQIGTDTNWSVVDAGNNHVLAVKTTGTLWAWGFNGNGELGDGTLTNRSLPVQIGTLSTWTSVSAGSNHGFAIKNDNTLWGWGRGGSGELGDNTTSNSSSPIQIGTNYSKVSAGGYYTLAIKTDGTLWGWGSNNKYQLGLGNTTTYSSPVQIGSGYASVSAGPDDGSISYGTSLAVKTNGTMWGWGNNSVGQVGTSINVGSEVTSSLQIGNDTNWSVTADGIAHGVALKTNNTLWGWGINLYGQVGDGTTNDSSSPIQIGSLISTTVDAYKSASITNQYLYDDVPLNIMIRRNTSTDVSSSNQSYDFILKTSKYGKLAIEQSASIYITGSTESAYNKSWVSDGNLFIGSGSNFKTNKMLSGSIFELRYWSKVLDTDSFDNHVLSARSYNGNTPTSSFYDLQGQWKFWQKFDVSITSSIVSSHPDQTKLSFYSSSKNAYLYGFGEESFEPIVESYNMEVATVAQDTPFSEKVRIDSASLNGGSLQKDWASDISAFDRYSVDSNKLMVAFSPQNTINEDIYESIGNFWIDDYFGEYSNVNREEYPRLKWFAREYWKKYKNRNDFTAYIRLISLFDFSVFDQIRQSLPARVNEILGLVIEPNILERSKVKVAKNFYAEPPEKFVKDTTELSKEAGLAISISTSNTTTVYVGFDEDISSEISEVEGEHDVITELNAETDDLNDDVDVLTTVSLENFSENGTIKYSPKMTSSSYQDLKGGLKKEYTFDGGLNVDHFAVISNRPNVIGTNNDIADYSILDIGFTNTFSRNNVIKGTQSGSISSPQWYFVPNEYSKRIAVFDTIYKNRNDDHYNAFKFYYTSSLNADGSNYSSYQYVTSSYMNPETFPVGQRNYRFNGCKLPDNDIINKFSYPNYSENYSYEDVNNDPSSIILLILPWEFLPSWLRTARQKQRDRR